MTTKPPQDHKCLCRHGKPSGLTVVNPPNFEGRVYIAGPMRGIPEFNHPAFDAAAAKWRANGWDVVSPAEEDRKIGLPASLPGGGVPPDWLRKAVAHNVAMLLTCDTIAVLPGWRESRGTLAELAVAAALTEDVDVFDAVTCRFIATAKAILSSPVTSVNAAPACRGVDACRVEAQPNAQRVSPRQL